jgi:hypothetical protein
MYSRFCNSFPDCQRYFLHYPCRSYQVHTQNYNYLSGHCNCYSTNQNYPGTHSTSGYIQCLEVQWPYFFFKTLFYPSTIERNLTRLCRPAFCICAKSFLTNGNCTTHGFIDYLWISITVHGNMYEITNGSNRAKSSSIVPYIR